MSSSWYLVSHEKQEIKFKFEFDNPDSVSSTTYGSDKLEMDIKNLAIFKSAESGDGIDVSTFENDKPKLTGFIPPIISDPEVAESLNESTDMMGKLTNFVSGGNFVISLIMGGSM